MRKFLSCLLIVALLVSISLTFLACSDKTSDDLKDLKYVDENGEIKTVTVAATDSPEEVTAMIMGLAGKEVNLSDLTTLTASAAAYISFTGKTEEQSYDYKLTASALLAAGIPLEIDPKDLKTLVNSADIYANASVSGNIPTALFEDDGDLTEITDFSKSTALNENANLYLDDGVLYTKLALSNDVTSVLGPIITDKYGANINNFNNTTRKLALADVKIGGLIEVLDLVSAYVGTKTTNKVFSTLDKIRTNTSVAILVNDIVKAVEEDDDDDSLNTAEEPAEATGYTLKYSDVLEIVKALHITITETDGTIVHFSANINEETIEYINGTIEDEEDKITGFKGSYGIDIKLDAKNMIDAKITVDLSGLAASLLAENPAISNVVFKVSATVIANEEVPTLTDDEKEAATPINTDKVVELLMNIISKKMAK